MAVDTTVTTFSDIRVDLRNRLREVSSTATNDIIDSWINTALHDIHSNPGHNFPWLTRRSVLITHAPYTTGTVSITAATSRTAVVGASTLWNTAVTGFGFNNARVGGKMTFSGLDDVYEVSAVGSDTSITLTNRYTGADLSAATYAYFEDEYALATDFLRPLDLRSFSTDLNIPLIGPMDFRRRFPRNSTRAKPKVATIIQLPFLTDTTARYRAVLHPPPDDEYSIPYDYFTPYLAVTSAGVEQTQLVNDTDEPIIPLQFRHVIPLHVMANWYRDRKDDTERSKLCRGEYTDLMQRMKGNTNIGADRPRFVVRSGIKGRYGAKYDGGSYFDELRDRYR